MENYTEALLAEMELGLVEHNESELQGIVRALDYVTAINERLRLFCHETKFATPDEEINFFREVKPQFTAKIIYFKSLRDIEINRPLAEGRHLRNYYVKCLGELEVTKNYSREFNIYYKSGDHTKDSLFFLRNPLLLKESKHISKDFDPEYMTPYDQNVANIIACSQLQQCLQGKIKVCNKKVSQNTLKWTGTKVELVELIYALHLAGKLNGGNAGLKQVAACMEAALNIELGHLHRIFLEIRERKNDRTKFLAALRENLIRYMEQADA